MSKDKKPAAPAARLLAFAQPMLDLLGDDPKPKLVAGWLRIAVDVWNAVTIEDWDRDEQAVPLARAKLLGEHPELIDAFDQLVERRRRDFAMDDWGIVEFDLSQDDQGEFRLSLEVRARLVDD